MYEETFNKIVKDAVSIDNKGMFSNLILKENPFNGFESTNGYLTEFFTKDDKFSNIYYSGDRNDDILNYINDDVEVVVHSSLPFYNNNEVQCSIIEVKENSDLIIIGFLNRETYETCFYQIHDDDEHGIIA